jgi:diguanylate cyclase (GGDEF)-like protein
MGGEEFVLVLLGTPAETAVERADQLRAEFEALSVQYNGAELQATISIGIATYPTHGDNGEPLLINADRALYSAKETGRNRVAMAVSQP